MILLPHMKGATISRCRLLARRDNLVSVVDPGVGSNEKSVSQTAKNQYIVTRIMNSL